MSSGGINLFLTDQSGAVVANTIVQIGPRGHLSKFLNELFAIQEGGFSTPLLLTMSSEIPVAVLALNFRFGDFASIPLTSLSSPTPVPVQALTPQSTFSNPTFVPSQPVIPSAMPGFGLGLPPSTPPTPIFSPPIATTGTPVPTTTTIGGGGSMVFPQVVAGGDWFTEITVGNTSSANQTIRIDFFVDGINTGSIPDVVIPPRGLVFLSTESLFTAFR
jgi:hypothetical protein